MHVLIDAADAEDFVVVSDGLRAEELLWLLQAALHALYLAHLCVQSEAVGDPAIITTEDKNLLVVQRETAHRVPGRPIVFTVDEDDGLPFLLVKITVAIQPLNAIQWLLILRVATTNHVKEAAIKNANRVEVAARVHLGDLGPPVLRDFIDFALFGGLIRVLRPSSEQEVLRSVLESLVQVGELMATATILHYSSSLGLVSLFIDDEAIVGNDSTNLVFFFLTSNAEHLVVDLDADEVFWKDVCVAKANLRCSLRR